MADLFDLVSLANKLQRDLDTASATEARRIATSWLASATLLTEWPTPIPEDLRTWGLELASLVYDNPGWVEVEQIGDVTTTYNVGHLVGQNSRRAEILAEARTKYGIGEMAGRPTGCFPEPECWPDPATAGVIPRWYLA